MHKPTFLLLSISLLFSACHNKSANTEAAFTGDVRMVTPFAQPSVLDGHMFLSNGRLRVEFGSMVTVYLANEQRGWLMFPEMRQYVDIGEKQVSTYLPHLTNRSPCPNSERPKECSMLGRESVGGRQATKWQLVNQHGEPVYLWTDDRLGIALRWEIENVTYEVARVHETSVADNMFQLPSGYEQAPEKWRRTFGAAPK